MYAYIKLNFLLYAILFVAAFVCAQHHGGGNHNPPHHPHPDNKQCHTDADCSGCVTNTTGYCNLQDNLCYCKPVTAKRAACHNGHQCSCPDGQNGVCNAQGHCECGDHPVGKRAVHVGSHCGQKSDCAGLDCAGQDYDCINMKCACHDNSHGQPVGR
ncbi:integrin beta-7-like [Mytilus californianus]|uniref:integrin beta-7-like n=1 Tax=Mytilus californianus TaxID=6549 RepID=UPI002247A18E|nr:integrin beta-7-like [Mytilus californianus]